MCNSILLLRGKSEQRPDNYELRGKNSKIV